MRIIVWLFSSFLDWFFSACRDSTLSRPSIRADLDAGHPIQHTPSGCVNQFKKPPIYEDGTIEWTRGGLGAPPTGTGIQTLHHPRLNIMSSLLNNRLHNRTLRHQSGLQVFPQGYQQLARQGNDTYTPHPFTPFSKTLLEPEA